MVFNFWFAGVLLHRGGHGGPEVLQDQQPDGRDLDQDGLRSRDEGRLRPRDRGQGRVAILQAQLKRETKLRLVLVGVLTIFHFQC